MTGRQKQLDLRLDGVDESEVLRLFNYWVPCPYRSRCQDADFC